MSIPPAGVTMSAAAVSAAMASQELNLEVTINGMPTHMIGRFRVIEGSLYSQADELRQLGLAVDAALVDAHGLVELGRMPTLRYRLDPLRQLLEITVAAERLETHRYEAGGRARLHPTAAYGGVLNYDVYAQRTFVQDGADSSSASALLDLRAFAPWGTFQQSGILRRQSPGPSPGGDLLRLDSTFLHSDADTLQTWRAGDLISGGDLAWTAPVRLGGLQWQRDFRLQPNLITFPVPLLSGSAAVPSTVDVYVNNVLQLSKPVAPGPFVINNLPALTGQGQMQVVVHDALGRATTSTLPFYAAPTLLKPGLSDYSLEAGFLRRNYGTSSDSYDRRGSASASWRYGLSPDLSLEAHGEGTAGLLNGGIGAVLGAGRWGVASLSAAGSHAGRGGAQLGLSYQFTSTMFSFYASTQRRYGDYQTLATLGQGLASPSIDQLSVSTGVGSGSLSLGYVRAAGGSVLAASPAGEPGCTSPCTIAPAPTRMATLSYTVSPLDRLSLSATAFREFSPDASDGAFVGLSYFFGGRTSASADVQYRRGQGATETVRAVESTPVEGTGLGWALQNSSGINPGQQAELDYRFDRVTAGAGFYHNAGSVTPYLEVRGAVVGMGGGLSLANPIYDSFALVDLGIPNVGITYENRPIGSTDSAGRLLVPNLSANVENHLGISPRDVPPDVEVRQTEAVATPATRSGVLVRFDVARENAATLHFRLADGSPVPLGSRVRINGATESFVIGYEGVAYLKHLRPDNRAVINLPGASCTASFSYRSRPGRAVSIGPVTCATGAVP